MLKVLLATTAFCTISSGQPCRLCALPSTLLRRSIAEHVVLRSGWRHHVESQPTARGSGSNQRINTTGSEQGSNSYIASEAVPRSGNQPASRPCSSAIIGSDTSPVRQVERQPGLSCCR